MARIDGIMSGWDTEGLVKAMVAHQQAQIDRLKQNTQKLTWQRERYTDIYNKIDTTRTKFYNYKLDSTTLIKSALSSNDSIVSAKGSADAVVGTHTITVSQLAKGAQIGSGASLSTGASKENIGAQLGLASDVNLKINGKDIEVKTSMSMNDLVKAINNSGAGVTASYDANLDRMFISTNETGAEAKIDFTGTDTAGRYFLKNNLKMPTNGPSAPAGQENWLKLTHTGQNAIFDLDGIKGLEQATNEFTISGITYNLKEVSPLASNGVDRMSTTITVNNDNDAIYKSVVDFVEMYNELLDSINGTVYEQKQKGYDPLTDEQRTAMTAEQIKEWEEKAQKGVLRNDALLMGIRNDMRTIIYSPVKGIESQMIDGRKQTLNSLFAIGLKTGGYSTNGKLEIDEEKLKAAISADPEAVNKIINGGHNADGTRTEGVADKLYDRLKKGMDDINDKSGAAAGGKEITSTLAKKIASNNTAINAKITRMNNMMATYYKQFDAMEQILKQMQDQSDSLASYMGA